MAFASTFELRLADGTPADPPTLTTAAPLWRPATRSRSALALAALMDGTIDVDSSPGHTTFSLVLPIHQQTSEPKLRTQVGA